MRLLLHVVALLLASILSIASRRAVAVGQALSPGGHALGRPPADGSRERTGRRIIAAALW